MMFKRDFTTSWESQDTAATTPRLYSPSALPLDIPGYRMYSDPQRRRREGVAILDPLEDTETCQSSPCQLQNHAMRRWH